MIYTLPLSRLGSGVLEVRNLLRSGKPSSIPAQAAAASRPVYQLPLTIGNPQRGEGPLPRMGFLG